MGFCRSCCVCSGLSLSIPVLFLAIALQLVPDGQDGIDPDSAAGKLADIPRVNASDLTPQAFYEKHVKKGIPVLIRLSPEDFGPFAENPDLLRIRMLESKCADRKVELRSVQQLDVSEEILGKDMEPWKKQGADWLMWLVSGIDIQGWVDQRKTTLRKLSQDAAAREKPQSFGMFVKLFGLLARVANFGVAHLQGTAADLSSAANVLQSLAILTRLLAQPVYLADMFVKDMCEEVLNPLKDLTSSYEQFSAEQIKLGMDKTTFRSLAELEELGLENEPSVKLFWGGPSSYSYPLHRDVTDGDVVCNMYSGCKDIVMLKQHSRKALKRIEIPGFEYMAQMTWSLDVFSEPPVVGVKGWKGTVHPGEMLYMPGDVLHHIRNSCPQSISLCRRPWRASEARDVFEESLKTMRLIREKENVDKGLRRLFKNARKR